MSNKNFPLVASFVTVMVFAGCDVNVKDDSEVVQSAASTGQSVAETTKKESEGSGSSTVLDDILARQPEEVIARYEYRHPKETLEFFGIEPGMTVVEALPGGGWYSKLLIAYLGGSGELVGANYPTGIYKSFGYDEERLAKMENWATEWPEKAQTWVEGDTSSVSGFVMGDLSESKKGTADAVLLIRALHNLARFEAENGYLTRALKDAFDVLKPGGIVGVVQHAAPVSSDDAWANGSNGYLKQSFVIEKMEGAGFEYVGASNVNANPLDMPNTDDFVWRLPPTLSGSKEDAAKKAAMQAIGESNRMTLKFVKPVI